MTATADMHSETHSAGDDELRTLVSAILSGGYREEIYLSDVSEICRRKPQSAVALRELIDRYHRLGRMPSAQHQKILARIAQSMPAPVPKSRTDTDAAGADGYPFEDMTCDLGAEPVIAPSTRNSPRETDLMPTLQQPPTRAAARAAPVPRLTARTTPAPRPRASAAPVSPPPSRPPARPMAKTPAEAIPEPFTERIAETETLVRPSTASASIAAAAAAISALAASASADATTTTPVPEPAIAVGRVLHERYELQLLLGRGGMASVYKAIDRDRVRFGLADCFVAVKVAPPSASRPASQAALGQEFQSAQRLSHPNVINVFDIDHDGETLFYTMELLSGARLSQVLRRVDGNVLMHRYALAIIRDIGAAITHAHARGVVHADLKPSNVMITHDGEVRVLDFGGQSMPTREPWVSEGDADEAYHPATPAYASCEQLERRRADPRDDIYALACIAYLLLSGRHPFDHLSSIEARARGMLARRPAGMPASQWRALRRGLAWSREQQPASIEIWLRQLGLDGAARSLPPLPDLTAAIASKHPWRRAAALGVPLLVAAAAGALALQSHPDVDWNGALSAASNGTQQSLHEAWRALQSLAGDSSADRVAAQKSTQSAAATVATAAALAAKTSATPSAAAVAPIVAAARAASPPAPAKAEYLASAAASAQIPHVTFTAQSYSVGAGDPAARIVIQRVGDLQADLSFVWWTEPASAEPDVDYASLGHRVEHMASGQDKLTVYVPIISGAIRSGQAQFHVLLGNVDGHGTAVEDAQSARATVTIDRGG